MDTIQQAQENFKELGFEKIDYFTEEPPASRAELEEMFGKDYDSLNGKSAYLIADLKKGSPEKIKAIKKISFEKSGRKILISGEFCPKDNFLYRLDTDYEVKKTWLNVISQSAARNGSFWGPVTDPAKEARHNARTKTIQTTIKSQVPEIKNDMGIDSEIHLSIEPFVMLRTALHMKGQNLPEMYNKFYKALRGIYD